MATDNNGNWEIISRLISGSAQLPRDLLVMVSLSHSQIGCSSSFVCSKAT